MSEKTLNNYVTLEDNVQLARVRHNEEVVAVIPRQEGKTASLQIYSGLADDKGVMDRNAIANALNIFKEQFPDAYANRTNHVNINNLFETPEGESRTGKRSAPITQNERR